MHQHDVEFRFCPVCGGQLQLKQVLPHEPQRLVCRECQFIFYLDPKLVACSIVEMRDGILLVKRDIEPQRGKWVIPGGYVDRGEEVHKAAIRETREECGIDVAIDWLLGVYSYPGKVQVVVVYVTRPLGGTPQAGQETSDIQICPIEQIPWGQLAFQSTEDALRDYIQSRRSK